MTEKIEIINPALPCIAIVGRPNVGKSTLFNRLIGHKKASVYDTPGLTRDRNYGIAEWLGQKYLLIDTGGYEASTDSIPKQMRQQAQMAIDEADLILFLTDIFESSNPFDAEILDFLRRKAKPFLLLVNKCDSTKKELEAVEFTRFGLDKYYTISAQHGRGVEDVLEKIENLIPQNKVSAEPEADDSIHVAIVGRQNAGKSTLTNKIIGKERVITSDIPGTTRDAIDTKFAFRDKTYTLIDTAGIRRRGKITRGVEFLSYLSCIKSLERSHVAILLIDIAEGIKEQDMHISGVIQESGCGCMIIANKWDKVAKDHKTIETYKKDIADKFKFLSWAPVLFISALSGQRVHKIFEIIDKIYEEGSKRIDTSELNTSFERYQRHQSPPSIKKGKQLAIKYVVQTDVYPPTFTLFVNSPDLMHFAYERYLKNQLRQEFGFTGNQIKFVLRKK